MQGEKKIIFIGINKINIIVKNLALASGIYGINFYLIEPWKQQYDVVRDSLFFNITTSDPFNCGFNFTQNYNRGSFYHKLEIE